MPTVLPPRRAIASKQNSDFSPLLGIIAALPALLTVLAEAQAMGTIDWRPFLPPDSAFVVPF
jgi:hypothetical protein